MKQPFLAFSGNWQKSSSQWRIKTPVFSQQPAFHFSEKVRTSFLIDGKVFVVVGCDLVGICPSFGSRVEGKQVAHHSVRLFILVHIKIVVRVERGPRRRERQIMCARHECDQLH